jgi:enoyl-CoA hydratase/carnithine racemase
MTDVSDREDVRGEELATDGLSPKATMPVPYATIRLDYATEDHIATITMDRPRTHNAVSFQMMDEIVDALEQIRFNNAIKVVILQGAGAHFSSGHDMKELALVHKDGQRRGLTERINRDRRRAGEGWEAIMRFPKPIVVKVQGKAIGAGAQMVLVADFAVASEDAELTMSPSRFGGPIQDTLMPLWILTVGLKMAKLIHYTGIGVPGRAAEKIGLVTKTVSRDRLDAETMRLAKAVALLPLDGLVASREWMNLQLGIMGVMPGLLPGYLGHALFSHVHYRDDEFNFLKTVRDEGMSKAYVARDSRFSDVLANWFDDDAKE